MNIALNVDNANHHIPVLLREVLKYLNPTDHEIYCDATFGAGGYSQAILDSAKCTIIALDRDTSVNKFVEKLKAKYPENFIFSNAKFSEIKEVFKKNKIDKVDGIVFDVGVSSMQLDEKNRGFSFDSTEKLDMRMDQTQGISAFEVVNNYSSQDLAKIIKDFGDEPKAYKIAQKIANKRSKQTITSCCELADIVRSLYVGYYKTDPATRTFQALRIYVNNELEELKKALVEGLNLLKKGGRMVVVSFHSLEDKIVKEFFKTKAGLNQGVSRYQPLFIEEKNGEIKLLNTSVVMADDEELKINNRARSAKLRAIIKM